MAINEKTKIGFVLIVLILLTSLVIQLRTKTLVVDVIYFRNPSCRVINSTDKIINELQDEFGKKMVIRSIKIQMHESEENDTQEIMELRKKYDVVGVPTIIINGKEYTQEFTKKGLKEEICKNFLIKPGVC